MPRYPSSTIFPVLAQVFQASRVFQVLQVPQVLRALPSLVLAQVHQVPRVLQVLRALQVLPSPVLEVSIGCSQST
jgi:hypothetical protein